MNKEEIIVNNKLIFDFMGKEYVHWTFENRTAWISARKDLKSNNFQYFSDYEDLKYHSSWDWLMSVLDKIETCMGDRLSTIQITKYIDVGHPMFGKPYCCLISTMGNEEVIEESDNKLECVYNACIKFIEWYNNQTTKI